MLCFLVAVEKGISRLKEGHSHSEKVEACVTGWDAINRARKKTFKPISRQE